jgi:hypothetical protein
MHAMIVFPTGIVNIFLHIQVVCPERVATLSIQRQLMLLTTMEQTKLLPQR